MTTKEIFLIACATGAAFGVIGVIGLFVVGLVATAPKQKAPTPSEAMIVVAAAFQEDAIMIEIVPSRGDDTEVSLRIRDGRSGRLRLWSVGGFCNRDDVEEFLLYLKTNLFSGNMVIYERSGQKKHE